MEAYTQCGKAGTDAVAAVTGEVGANIISQNLFGKEPENLTEAEKRTVSELSQVTAGLAGGLASGSGSSLSTAQSVKTGQGVGKNAVENNTFGDIHPSDDREQSIKSIAKAMFKGDEEKAEAYYDGLKQGEAKALIEGIEGTVEAVQHFDETIVTIAEALGNPKETVQKVVISLEELNARINSALETNPAEAGELMGYLQSQGKAIQAPTVILTGEVAEKVVRLLKKSPQVDYKSDVNNLGVNSAKFDKELNTNILNRVNGSFYNIDAVNKLRKGKLPGDGLDRKTGLPVEGKIGVPRNMPSSKDPDTMAINFAEQFLGRRVTPEEWEAGRKMFKNKDCINCFKVDLGNRQSIVYRSGVNENSSSKTLSGTATLEINTTEIKELNSGEVLKLKFPTSEIGR
ncbi:VENN motif pre-toxin domain-containing protein [Mannheimia sp. E30BD]|uniref:VENN motif pre-toxin domain-containing protein n=1 Tax=Mannheimia sp. E30BD TaxID=3278708 RepID=UPI00359D3567